MGYCLEELKVDRDRSRAEISGLVVAVEGFRSCFCCLEGDVALCMYLDVLRLLILRAGLALERKFQVYFSGEVEYCPEFLK